MSRTQDFQGRKSHLAVLGWLGLAGIVALGVAALAIPPAREAFANTAGQILALLGIAVVLFAAVLLLVSALWFAARRIRGGR